MSDEEDASRYGMIMPFLAVTSVGGPFEDTAYCAGYEAGRAEATLEYAKPEWWGSVVRTENVEQIDLIGMRFGYVMTKKIEHDHGWTTIKLSKTSEPLPENPNKIQYIFTTREDAERCLTTMMNALDRYGYVSLMDLCWVIGLNPKPEYKKFGWTSLAETTIGRVRAGYILDFPDVKELS